MSRAAAISVALALAAPACAPSWKHTPHDRLHQVAPAPVLHRRPQPTDNTDWWDHVLHSTVVPLGRLVSPARYVAWAIGGRPALDVNAFGEVPDSPWFENRIAIRELTPAEIKRGPNVSGPPAPGMLTIISGKPEGVTPGIVVRDRDETIWFIKFDPPANPEMTTGAETVASKLLWAAGYHVPEIYVGELDLNSLALAPDATTRDDYNRTVPFTEARLRDLLTQLNPDLEGKVRALFSRAVPGQPIGSFSYRGTRGDDPNDTIPHERRRSLRGLWLLAAWVNNHDTRRQNTLDTFIEASKDGELGYLRHYLIDFGDALGATGSREKAISEGYEYWINWGEIGKNFLALGLRYPYWYQVQRSPYRSVGIFEAEIFEPGKWSPQYPNPAFREATPRDTFWAATILARFDKDQILAAVTAGQYSEAGAVDWIYRVLVKRREKLLRYAFRAMLALVDPTVELGYDLVMRDLEVEAGVARAVAGYEWRVRWNRTGAPDRELATGESATPRFDLRAAVTRAMKEDPDGFRRDPYLTLTIRRPRRRAKGPKVEVHLRVVRDQLLPVAIEREVARWL